MNDELKLAMAAKEAVFPELLKRLQDMQRELLSVCDQPYGAAMNHAGIKRAMDAVIEQVRDCSPHEETPEIAKLSYSRPWITKKERRSLDKIS